MPNETLSQPQQQQLLARILKWKEANGYPVRRIAAVIECPYSTISQVLKGTYRSDPTRYLLMLRDLLDDPEKQKRLGEKPKLNLVRTSVIADMETAVEWAYANNKCVLIWGPSGMGKTAYAMARAELKPNCVYVHLDDEKYTRTRLLRRVFVALGFSGHEANCYNGDALLDKICDHIGGTPRVIFVDNAHVLDKHNLWTLHSLFDRTASTIVCLGQPKLYQTVIESRSDHGVGATIFARFSVKLDLTASTQYRVNPSDPDRRYRPAREYLLTLDDIKQYLAARNLKVSAAGVDWLHRMANCPTSGGLHTVNTVLDIAAHAFSAEYVKTGQLELNHLQSADTMTRPPAEQALFAREMQELRPASKAG